MVIVEPSLACSVRDRVISTQEIKKRDVLSVLISVSAFVAMSSMIEQSKKLAASTAVDKHVNDGDVVGVGSGSTIVYAVQRLAERVQKEGIKVRCIPTSFQVCQGKNAIET